MPLEILSKDQSHPVGPQDAGASMWKVLGRRGEGRRGEGLRSPGLGPVFLSFACSKGVSSTIFKPMLQGETAYTMAIVTECFCGKQYPRTAPGRKDRACMDPSL